MVTPEQRVLDLIGEYDIEISSRFFPNYITIKFRGDNYKHFSVLNVYIKYMSVGLIDPYIYDALKQEYNMNIAEVFSCVSRALINVLNIK